MLGIGLSIPQVAATGSAGWFDAPAFADLCAIADFNRWRFALPAAALADIPAATAGELCVKRPCTAAEFFAFTCSSTSARTYTDATGTLRADLAVDQLRKDWINGRLQLALNGASTNQIGNNTMAGAVAGTPGALPTGWFRGDGSGIATAVAGLGIEGGIPYIDIAVTGTATANNSNYVFVYFGGTNSIVAASGQVWTHSAFMRVVSGAAPSGLGAHIGIRDSSGAIFATDAPALVVPAASLGAARIAGTVMLTDAATAFVQQRGRFNLVSGTIYNFVVRIGLPQLEQQSFATPPIFTASTAVTRAIESARLSPAVEAILQRSEGSIIVRGQNMMRAQGHIIAPQSSSLIQSNATNERAVTNSASGVLVTGIGPNFSTVPYAVGVAFSSAGRAVVRNGVAVATDTGTVPARTAVYLARDGSGTFCADGWYDFLAIAPSRLANARLTELAVPA